MNLFNSSILAAMLFLLVLSCRTTPKGARAEDSKSAQESDSARDLDANSDDDNFWDKDEEDQSAVALSYNNGIQSIVNEACVSCHGNDSDSVYPNLSSYDLLKFSAKRSVTYIESGSMPKAPITMSNENKAKFKSWVENGMQEGDEASGSESDATTYSDIELVVENSCGNCHTTGQTYPPLGSEPNLKKHGQSALNSVNAGRMPPQSSGKSISSTNLNKLKNWLQDNN